MADSQKDYMQIAKESFLELSANDRLIFIDWARKEADKDLYTMAKEERIAFLGEVKDGINKGSEKAQELGEKAVNIIEKSRNKLDDMFRDFLGEKKKD